MQLAAAGRPQPEDVCNKPRVKATNDKKEEDQGLGLGVSLSHVTHARACIAKWVQAPQGILA